eukprot:gnl/Hemi2/5771_TR1985_c0_g10_i1.p1 gnl/Hemi2/5771_TR1985_c0_g10~~gnl/Hemi2/5771_TR1985_c0_g10_i1.p1  ORF type:complete len:441 (+),score=112.26 gnl/Hemi2/5771_TR1985_c0_g10_i1:94-1323(+)
MLSAAVWFVLLFCVAVAALDQTSQSPISFNPLSRPSSLPPLPNDPWDAGDQLLSDLANAENQVQEAIQAIQAVDKSDVTLQLLQTLADALALRERAKINARTVGPCQFREPSQRLKKSLKEGAGEFDISEYARDASRFYTVDGDVPEQSGFLPRPQLFQHWICAMEANIATEVANISQSEVEVFDNSRPWPQRLAQNHERIRMVLYALVDLLQALKQTLWLPSSIPVGSDPGMYHLYMLPQRCTRPHATFSDAEPPGAIMFIKDLIHVMRRIRHIFAWNWDVVAPYQLNPGEARLAHELVKAVHDRMAWASLAGHVAMGYDELRQPADQKRYFALTHHVLCAILKLAKPTKATTAAGGSGGAGGGSGSAGSVGAACTTPSLATRMPPADQQKKSQTEAAASNPATGSIP